MILQKLFTSKIRYKILEQFFVFNNKNINVRSISRLINSAVPPVSRELHNLEEAGVLKSIKNSNGLYYQLDENCEIIPELKALLMKTSSYKEKIKKELKKVKSIKKTFIFGSYAEGTQTAKSDIDIFIIGEPDLNKLNLIINKLEKNIHIPIEYIVMPEKELLKRDKSAFVKNVLKSKKIFLIGEKI